MNVAVTPEPRSQTESGARSACRTLAPLFQYPDRTFEGRIADAQKILRDENLEAFAAEMFLLQLGDRQAVYTSTFDLAPSCNPYVGAHRFGDESPERSRLMVGLRTRYGGNAGSELPDHIAEIFGFAREFDDEEWQDLGRLIVLPALQKMEEILRPSGNPYRHLLAAALTLCTTEFSDGGAR